MDTLVTLNEDSLHIFAQNISNFLCSKYIEEMA